MKTLFYLLSFALLLSCNKASEEHCPLTGVPPAKFRAVIAPNSTRVNDFFDNGTLDKSVYFYKISSDGVTKIPFKTTGITSPNHTHINIPEENWEKSIITGNLETIYLNNKGKTEIIQIRVEHIVKDACTSVNETKELIVNGVKQEKLPNLNWDGVVHTIE